MKLTDLCLVFVMVFICLILPTELRIRDDREKYYSEKQFNRMMDRIAADTMEDVVVSEDENGNAVVDEDKVHENFERLITLAFDVEDSNALQKIHDSIYLNEHYDIPESLSYEQSEAMRLIIEDSINERADYEQINNYRRDTAFFSITFPFSDHESWYQKLTGPVFFIVFDPDDGNVPWVGYNRIVFSGSRIEKRVDK